MGKIKSYVKQVLAFAKGDNAEVIAQQNYRFAQASFKGQLAALEGQKVKDEIAVEQAKDALAKTIHPTTTISHSESFINRIVDAQRDVDLAEESLARTEESIEYFKALAAAEEAEVDE